MKISVKLFLSFIVIIVASLAINSVLVLHRSFQSGLQEKETSTTMLNKLTARQVQQLDYQQVKGIKQDQVVKFVGATQDNVLIWNQHRDLIYHEDVATNTAKQIKVTTSNKQQVQYLLQGKEKIVVATIKVRLLRKTYYISSFTNLHTVYVAQKRLLHDVQVNLSVIFIIAAGVVYVLTKQILVPVHKLRGASRAFQAEPMTYQPLQPVRHDELTELMIDFNQMAHQIQAMVATERHNAAFQKEFASHLTHEINTPLTIILGYAELIAAPTVDETTKAEAIRYIVEESTRLKELGSRISQLIQYDHVTLDTAWVSSDEVHAKVTDIVIGIRQQATQPMDFRYETPQTYQLNTDMSLFAELLMNVLDNAIKALPDAGGRIVVSESLTSAGLEIRIQDNGHGIATEKLGDVFAPFVTGSQTGTDDHLGLGLSIVQRIIEALNWQITLQNNSEGAGAMVIIQIPQAAIKS